MSGSGPLDERIDHLFRRSEHIIKLGLDATENLLAELDRPQDSFLAIHVAGTNGKGSVCAMLASILSAAGFRTGLYISPHLVRFNERISVNGERIDDASLATAMDQVEAAAMRAMARPNGRNVTFFEFTTAMAFDYFRRKDVQIAVLETGMGGRLDSTNVVTPAVSVITSIGLDHQEFLGNTIAKIAAEKAGIIKQGRPLVIGELVPEAMEVVTRTARQLDSTIHRASEIMTVTRLRQTVEGQRIRIEGPDAAWGPLNLPLLGHHQLANTAIAATVIHVLGDELHLPVAKGPVEDGLQSVRWPARFQVLEKEPPVVIDGAHNPAAAAVLGRTLREIFPDRPVALVAGFLADKDARGILQVLAGQARAMWSVPIRNSRAMTQGDIAVAARGAGIDCIPSTGWLTALDEARKWAAERGGVVCITGSLYLAGEVLSDRT